VNRLDQIPDCTSLRILAQRRLPRFVWEYLVSGTGDGQTMVENRMGLDRVKFETRILEGEFAIDYSTSFLKDNFKFPLGVAPVGMSGLVTPNAEIMLASAALEFDFPYVLSTVAACSLERLVAELDAPRANIEKNIWFQLYCPKDPSILENLLRRAWKLGIRTLVVTLDLPGPSVREQQIKSGLSIPPSLNFNVLTQCFVSPRWSISRLRAGRPRLENLEQYNVDRQPMSSTNHIGYQMRVNPDPDYIRKIRAIWGGKIILKGISSRAQITSLKGVPYDSIWVSNHGGRQFAAHRSAIQCLEDLSGLVNVPLIVDGGVESALDVLRYFGAGASIVMAGRAWHFGLAALRQEGATHCVRIFARDLEANLRQMGMRSLKDLSPAYQRGVA